MRLLLEVRGSRLKRPLRIEYSGAFYHVLNCGQRQDVIVDDDHSWFSDSLDEFNEYGSKVRNEINWHCPPKELITGNSTEHSVLDGTGGLYYDPNNGDMKLNLTKPLKGYWIFYFGEKRNDVPADW